MAFKSPEKTRKMCTEFSVEITVLSADGLKTGPSLFSSRLRPFIALSSDGGKRRHVYRTSNGGEPGLDPTWGDKFRIPVDPVFFSGIHVELYHKRLVLGRAHLGWCHVSAQDIIGSAPGGSTRFLSYRLRAGDGSRTRAVINLAVKLDGFGAVSGGAGLPTGQTVIGIPVGPYRGRLGVRYTGF